jgi:hypothetical protein
LGAETSLPEAFFSLWRKDKRPRSCNSQTAFRKNTPERERRIRLMNRPSTVVMEPAVKIQTIPATGTRQKTMEIKNVAARKRPPLVTLILDSSATRLSLKPRAVCACAQFTCKDLHGVVLSFLEPRPTTLASLFKGHIYSLTVFGGERHFHVLFPQFFLHKG